MNSPIPTLLCYLKALIKYIYTYDLGFMGVLITKFKASLRELA